MTDECCVHAVTSCHCTDAEVIRWAIKFQDPRMQMPLYVCACEYVLNYI